MSVKKIAIVLFFSSLFVAAGWADNINGITMDFVQVGNPGNAADTDADPERNGYGAVSYSYRIGVTEVSLSQFTASGIVDANANYWNDGTRTLGVEAPVVSISWHEAARYCNWLTTSNANLGAYNISGGLVTAVDRAAAIVAYGTVYVLPTEDEWYKAAYYTGSGYSLYANGTGTAPVHGVDANFATAGGYTNGPAWTVTSGTAEANHGTKNMMGNVWEWLESADDGTLDNIGEAMAFRGGDYFQGSVKLRASELGNGELAAGEFLNTGMRIVAIPEPGTLSLTGMSCLGLFAARSLRRRRLTGRSVLPIEQERLCDSFLTKEEWCRVKELQEEVGPDYLQIAWGLVYERMAMARENLLGAYTSLDHRFWDYMVVSYEQRKIRRTAFRAECKRKTLYTLDAFLERIMK